MTARELSLLSGSAGVGAPRGQAAVPLPYGFLELRQASAHARRRLALSNHLAHLIHEMEADVKSMALRDVARAGCFAREVQVRAEIAALLGAGVDQAKVPLLLSAWQERINLPADFLASGLN